VVLYKGFGVMLKGRGGGAVCVVLYKGFGVINKGRGRGVRGVMSCCV